MGARFLVFRSRSTYAVAEFAPRLVGYDGGASLILIGIEKRIGGHSFQINLSNGFGTTLTQVGHGVTDCGCDSAGQQRSARPKQALAPGFQPDAKILLRLPVRLDGAGQRVLKQVNGLLEQLESKSTAHDLANLKRFGIAASKPMACR